VEGDRVIKRDRAEGNKRPGAIWYVSTWCRGIDLKMRGILVLEDGGQGALGPPQVIEG
jgi:hypothetical protein